MEDLERKREELKLWLQETLKISLAEFYDLTIKQKGRCKSCQKDTIREFSTEIHLRQFKGENVLLCSDCHNVMKVMVDGGKGANIIKFFSEATKEDPEPFEPNAPLFPQTLGF